MNQPVLNPFSPRNWGVEHCKDGLYHRVSHEHKLAAPGLTSKRAAYKSARLVCTHEAAMRRMQERYKQLFGGGQC